MVKGVIELEDIGGSHNRRSDMVDALEGIEGLVEQSQNRLVVRYICWMEDCPRRSADAGFIERWPVFTAHFDQPFTVGTVHITYADVATALAAELG